MGTHFCLEAVSKLGFLPEIKARPSLNPQAYFKYVEDLRRGRNAEFWRKDFFEMASNHYLIIPPYWLQVNYLSRRKYHHAFEQAPAPASLYPQEMPI